MGATGGATGATGFTAGPTAAQGNPRLPTASSAGAGGHTYLKPLMQMDEHTDWVNQLIYLENTEAVLSCSNDTTIKLWSAEGACIQTLTGHSSAVHALSVWQGMLASGSGDGTVKIWNFSNGQKLTQLISKDAGYIYKNPEQVFPTKSNATNKNQD